MSAFGVAVGTLVWVTASAVGVGLLLERSSTAFTILKLAAAAYVCYLGVQSMRSSPHRRRPAGAAGAPHGVGSPGAWAQGLFSNLLNPKTGAFFVTVMPQFTLRGDPPSRLVVMVAIFEVMLVAWLIAYGRVFSRFGRSGIGSRFRHAMTKVTGIVLIGLGARLAFERR